ncbi:hypothetical protein [Hymenobacter negativus]|uniref:PepSY domain-containing protein n=1 Tax=Hymenobacter negativus TaxID=2795026 RepID=A0ABS3Q979_9BACT|nr:hypothetical protein [Hymenobacter negativus]MBO2007812.1 hypothetical protein [Hymenobacter negativus]
MFKPLAFLLLGAACTLTSCQQTPPSTATPTTPEAPVATPPAAPTQLSEADARAAVGKYIQTQPNAALFVVDSARVNDNEATWQVLVPRTDWAKRMPNAARFEVDKTTGAVSTGTVK